MAVRKIKGWMAGVAVALIVATLTPPAQAQDFFSNFFRSFGRSRGPSFGDFQQSEPRQRYGGGGQAYCVRTCDGRYFPISGTDKESRSTACNALCPSADTELVYGSPIDNAATENGKPYSKLPNAFRYRNELVAGCSCNGKDAVGLAQVDPEKDPTLRSGDIVAGANGLVVANKRDRRGASVEFSPASDRIKQRYRHPPVVARE
jgi:Protein of unknown function (DUF2865)